jgi:hypothetical protein
MPALSALSLLSVLSLLSFGLALLAGGCGGADSPPPAAAGKAKAKAKPSPPASAPADINPAEAYGEYLQTVVKSKKQAETLADKITLGVVGQDLTMYAATHGGQFPAALADLGRRDLLRAPGPDGQEYQYVSGQQSNSPRTNILAYEKLPVHNGKALALRVSGTVDLLAPADLEAALAQTKKKLK